MGGKRKVEHILRTIFISRGFSAMACDVINIIFIATQLLCLKLLCYLKLVTSYRDRKCQVLKSYYNLGGIFAGYRIVFVCRSTEWKMRLAGLKFTGALASWQSMNPSTNKQTIQSFALKHGYMLNTYHLRLLDTNSPKMTNK